MKDAGPAPARRGAGDGARILVLVAVAVLTSGVQGIAIPLIARFPEYLDADAVDSAWVLTATLLVGVVSTPIAGRLADLVGKRRVLVAQLTLVLLGSLVVTFEQGLVWAIIGRGMQGVALGMVPVGLGLLRDAVHPTNLTPAIVAVSAGLGLGGAVGHVVAAVVADASDWHFVFAGTALCLALTLFGVVRILPAGPRGAHGRFDYLGALLLTASLTCTLLVLSKFTVWGWSPTVFVLIAVAACALAAFVVVELRSTSPIVNLRVLGSRPIVFTDLAAFGVGFGSFVGFGSLPQLMQAPVGTEVGLGLSLLESALILAVVGIAMLVVTPLTRAAMERFGPPPVLTAGCIVLAGAMIWALFLLGEVWQVVVVVTLSGVGIGFASSAMPAIIMRSVHIGETAAANGLMTVLQTLGSAVAAALAGAIIGGGAVVVDGIASPTRDSYTQLFLIGAGSAVISLIASLLSSPRRVGRAVDAAVG